MRTRRGMGVGLGCGYKNLAPLDSHVHSLSAKGIKTYQVKLKNVSMLVNANSKVEAVNKVMNYSKLFLAELDKQPKIVSKKDAEDYNLHDMVVNAKGKHILPISKGLKTVKTVKYNDPEFIPHSDGLAFYKGKMYGTKEDLKYMPNTVRLVSLSAKSCLDKYLPIVKPNQYFDKRLIEQGIKVEMEHTKNRSVAKRIALAHLNESKLYYYQLAKMEKTLNANGTEELMANEWGWNYMKQPKKKKVSR